MGGTGKSYIASYFHKNADFKFKAKFWADVSLKPDFTVFAEKIVIALDGKVNYPPDITQLINNLLQLLSERRCLLVVDNLETLLDKERNWQDEYYQEFFRRWLQQGTTSTLLLTTQDKPSLFQGLQFWYPLGGMKITEGVELFNKFGIIATEAESKEFVEYVQGHPLTIKLVAGYLRDYNSQFSYIEELQLEQFELAYQEAAGLHRNKTDARLVWIIQQHLGRLSLEQAQFLFGLSVYRLPFNRQAASYMWQEEEVKPIVINKKLQELCNRSLLIKTENSKFQFESLVQKFILQQTNDLTTAHLQAIEYYKANLKDAESWQVLEDVTEYLEIVDHHCELQQYTLANGVLNSCSDFLNLRGYYAVLVEVYEKLTQGWQSNLQPEDKSDYAWALNYLGNAYDFLGEYQQVIDFHQQALDIAREFNDFKAEGAFLNGLGNAYYSLGDFTKSIVFYQQALRITEKIKDINNECSCLNNLGNTYCCLAQYEESINFYQQALTIANKIEDVDKKGLYFNNLGNVYNKIGKYQQAVDLLQQSLNIQRETGNRYVESLSLINIGISYKAIGDYKKSECYFQQSLKISKQIKDLHNEASALNSLGEIYNNIGKYKKAIIYRQQSLKIQRKIGDLHGEGLSLTNLGNTYNLLEQYPEAIAFYEQARKIQQNIGDLNGKSLSLMGLGNACYSQEEYQQAIDYLKQSLAIFQQIGDRRGEASTWFNLGITQKKLQKNLEAKVAYENARKLFQAMGLDRDVAKCNKAIKELENDDSSK